jgi:hypothetical protein
VAADGFDARSVVIIDGVPGGELATGGYGRIISYRRGWSEIEAVAEAPRGGYLVLSEMAHPSWRATLNGVTAQILHADYLLQAVWLPPGLHRLTVAFDPGTVVLGVQVTLATLTALACYFGLSELVFRARSRALRGDSARRPALQAVAHQ